MYKKNQSLHIFKVYNIPAVKAMLKQNPLGIFRKGHYSITSIIYFHIEA